MEELYQRYKRLLFTLAYQLTGSASDAEDVVQDVFLKVYDVDPARLEEPKAYLCKMVTNRCKDLLKSARKRREQYFGPWLPEPILTPEDETCDSVIQGELLSYGMLVLLERLTPSERTVFVLREALGFEYAAIAEVAGKAEANCRKLYSRARSKMGITEETALNHSDAASEQWIRQFLAALELGNVESIVSMLAEDAAVISDGGGLVTAAVHPIETRDRVIRFLLGLFKSAARNDWGIRIAVMAVNGQPGMVIRSKNGIEVVGHLQMKDGVIQRIYMVRNPDKLKGLAISEIPGN